MQHLEINWFNLTAEADRVLCQLVMFLILDVQNEIQLPSRVFCYSWLVCLFVQITKPQTEKRLEVYWVFGRKMRRLSKSEIRFRIAPFSFFTLLDAETFVTWK